LHRFDSARKNDDFTETGSGQTPGKFEKRDAFFSQAIEWRGQNPHRLSLGQLALRKILGGSDGSDGSNGMTATIDPAELTNINQTLDLWKGVAHSRFELAGTPVVVNTTVHGDADVVSTR